MIEYIKAEFLLKNLKALNNSILNEHAVDDEALENMFWLMEDALYPLFVQDMLDMDLKEEELDQNQFRDWGEKYILSLYLVH